MNILIETDLEKQIVRKTKSIYFSSKKDFEKFKQLKLPVVLIYENDFLKIGTLKKDVKYSSLDSFNDFLNGEVIKNMEED